MSKGSQIRTKGERFLANLLQTRVLTRGMGIPEGDRFQMGVVIESILPYTVQMNAISEFFRPTTERIIADCLQILRQIDMLICQKSSIERPVSDAGNIVVESNRLEVHLIGKHFRTDGSHTIRDHKTEEPFMRYDSPEDTVIRHNVFSGRGILGSNPGEVREMPERIPPEFSDFIRQGKTTDLIIVKESRIKDSLNPKELRNSGIQFHHYSTIADRFYGFDTRVFPCIHHRVGTHGITPRE